MDKAMLPTPGPGAEHATAVSETHPAASLHCADPIMICRATWGLLPKDLPKTVICVVMPVVGTVEGITADTDGGK